MASRFILGVDPRDADTPGYYDLRLDVDKLVRHFRHEPCIDRLCRKMNMCRTEVLRHFTPGIYVMPETGEASLNAGYDPDFDEGSLELLIWAVVRKEACELVTDRACADR